MSYDIEVKELESQPTAVVRRQIKKSELGDAFGKELPRLAQWLASKDIQMAGVPFGRYFDFTDEKVDLEIGIPVAGPFEGDDGIEPSELPSGNAATTVHVGSYDNLPGAYEAVSKWIDASEHKSSGPPWESYFTDPGTEPDQTKWQTGVFFPIN